MRFVERLYSGFDMRFDDAMQLNGLPRGDLYHTSGVFICNFIFYVIIPSDSLLEFHFRLCFSKQNISNI